MICLFLSISIIEFQESMNRSADEQKSFFKQTCQQSPTFILILLNQEKPIKIQNIFQERPGQEQHLKLHGHT